MRPELKRGVDELQVGVSVRLSGSVYNNCMRKTFCVCKPIPACPRGGNAHRADASLWGVTVYWNPKYVSHHGQNTEQCLYKFTCYWYCRETQWNKKPNNNIIEVVRWAQFHGRDLFGLSHDGDKETGHFPTRQKRRKLKKQRIFISLGTQLEIYLGFSRLWEGENAKWMITIL